MNNSTEKTNGVKTQETILGEYLPNFVPKFKRIAVSY